MIKHILIVVFLLCYGCAGIVIPLDNMSSMSVKNVPFEFIDLRTNEEKNFRPLKEGHPYHYYGDKEFEPDRMDVLKGALIQHFGQKLSGHRIEITQFEFIAYIPGVLKKTKLIANGAVFGLLGAAIVAAIVDKPDMGDRFVCSIEAIIDGKPIVVTDFEPIPGYIDLSPTKEAGNILIQRIIQSFVIKAEAELT